MRSTVIVIGFIASLAAAAPGGKKGGGSGGSGGSTSYTPCPSGGLYSVAQCCATDVLGVADLNCVSPPSTPTSASSFASICSTNGLSARCCAIPVLGQAVLCETPVGV